MRSRRFSRRVSGAAALALAAAAAFVPGELQASAGTGTPAASTAAAPTNAAPGQGTSFQNLNGFMWFYNSYFHYKYTDITKNLGTFKQDGIRVLAFFAPYAGDEKTCDGCDPLDFYQVSPQNGTMQDWRNLVKAAHARGIKVVAYFINGYLDANAPYFLKAQQEYAAGDRTSREVSSFAWTTDPDSAKPTMTVAGPNQWTWSPIAHAYYWQLWFGPGFDYDLPGSTAEVARIEKFWLDTGLDGFMWDATKDVPSLQPYDVTLPETYTKNPKWLASELEDSSNAAAHQSFGLTDWFNYKNDDTVNDYTRIANGSIDANGLETALENNDWAREHGDTTHAWSIWGDDDATNLSTHTYPTYPHDDVMRVQEAALLAGSGILYGSGMYDQYIRWSPTLRANWDRVLRTVNANQALLPAASRNRVPAGSDPKVFAERRTSTDGKQTALLVYNFNSTAQNVTVDLTGTGISTHQVPKDLYNGGRGSAITGSGYTVHLPAHGFTMLQVSGS